MPDPRPATCRKTPGDQISAGSFPHGLLLRQLGFLFLIEVLVDTLEEVRCRTAGLSDNHVYMSALGAFGQVVGLGAWSLDVPGLNGLPVKIIDDNGELPFRSCILVVLGIQNDLLGIFQHDLVRIGTRRSSLRNGEKSGICRPSGRIVQPHDTGIRYEAGLSRPYGTAILKHIHYSDRKSVV